MYGPFDLTGKVALITGGNGGIGLAMAEALAAAGADIVVWGSNPTKNAEAEHALSRSGRRVLVERVDVANETQIVEGMRRAIALMGRIDTVIANAATSGISTKLIDVTADDLRKVLAINLGGTFFTAREACRHMITRAEASDPGGSIVLVGSTGAQSGMPRFGPYAASKGALPSLMRSIVVENAHHGIRVNVIEPGFVETVMTDHQRANSRLNEWILANVPVHRWGQPEEFGGIAVYLASDASRFHNGTVIPIDGGYLAT